MCRLSWILACLVSSEISTFMLAPWVGVGGDVAAVIVTKSKGGFISALKPHVSTRTATRCRLLNHGHGHATGAQHFVDALVVPAGDFAGGEAVAAFDVEDEDDLLQQQAPWLGPTLVWRWGFAWLSARRRQ